MRKSQILMVWAAILLTASAGFAWRHHHASEPRISGANVRQSTTASDRSLMQTPSNESIPPVANRITITNLENVPQANRPTTISRFFAPGEVPAGSCAQAVIDASPVPTQCNAMTHWPDGSLQHAMLTFKATFGGSPVEVGFVPTAEPLSGPGLDVAAMTSSDYDFTAILEVETADGYQCANAREMLKAGMYRYRLQGRL